MFMNSGNFSSYLTYGEEDLKWQIVCNDAGYNEIVKGQTYPPNIEQHPEGFKSVGTGRTLNEFQIIYITSGAGTYVVEEKTYKIRPGSIMLIFPGVKHSYKPDLKTGWTEYWIGFSGPYPENLYKTNVITPTKSHFELGLHDTILYIYNKIFDQIREQKPGFQIRCGADTISLLAEIISLSRNQDLKSGNEEVVENIKFILEENLYKNLDINSISEKMSMSKPQLNTIFKSYTGMSPYQYFLNIKINKAKEWLDLDTYPVKEIALNLSFSDPLYFTRLFTKKTGVSPSKWRIYH